MIVLACVAFVIFNNIKRGKRFIRAYVYIETLDGYIEMGNSEDKAINLANELALKGTLSKYSNADADNVLIHSAKAYANQFHDGRQLPVIKEAIRKGFLG